VIDYHVHLWRHAPHLSLQATVEQLAGYCERAATLGVTEIAVTEHTSRFGQVDAVVGRWWENDQSAVRREETAGYWHGELGADLDQYVDTALAARQAGLPVVIGLEVDYFPGQMDKVAALLRGYPFDVLLGSVHWIGAWLINALGWAPTQREWSSRDVDQVWDDYTSAVEELAATGSVDVLAHPDLVKIAGRQPSVPAEFHDRIAEAARASGLAAELNSSGWRRPCAEAYPADDLLARFLSRGVPITTASDGHRLEDVSWRIGDVTTQAFGAGYREISVFRGRSRLQRALQPPVEDGASGGELRS
jgi:histidinol-phosphatase (PHP family)